jgi:PAS domain S-box-containing protein
VVGRRGRTLGFEVRAHITEEKRAEQELRRSEERFRALVENSYEVIGQIDRESRWIYASHSVLRILGYTVHEILETKRFGERIHPEDIDAVLENFRAILGIPDRAVTMEFRGRHKDGSWRVFEAVAVNQLEEPSIGTIVVNLRDITERKRAAEALRRSEERFRALVENSSEVIGLFDSEGHWLYASPSVERLWGYTAEEMTPWRQFGERAHPDDVEALRERFRSLAGRPDGMDTMEFRGRHKDGTWRVFGPSESTGWKPRASAPSPPTSAISPRARRQRSGCAGPTGSSAPWRRGWKRCGRRSRPASRGSSTTRSARN